MSRARTLDEIQIAYLETHPEKIEAFITVSLDTLKIVSDLLELEIREK